MEGSDAHGDPHPRHRTVMGASGQNGASGVTGISLAAIWILSKAITQAQAAMTRDPEYLRQTEL